ncbi:MAG: hypothetical protein IH827_08100, partial [Myxococcales bacterium]|nr:hypothetical protein [Myxococcales bacterium]
NFHNDNGRAYKKATGTPRAADTLVDERVSGIASQLGTQIHEAIPYHAWSKGVCERFSRTVKDAFERWFELSFWGTVADRPEDRDRATRERMKELPTIDDIRASFGVWLQEHHALVQDGVGMNGLSPALKVEQHGDQIRRVPEEAALFVCSLPEKKPRRYGRDGVLVDQLLYRVKDAKKHVQLQGTKVWARKDPRSGSFVLVCGQNARSAGDAEIGGAAPGRAEPQHQDLLIRDSFHQRSFSVDKATSPRIADTIQKRTTIFCSGQPSFSKW